MLSTRAVGAMVEVRAGRWKPISARLAGTVCAGILTFHAPILNAAAQNDPAASPEGGRSLASKAEPSKPTGHTARNVEGWEVQVGDRLLDSAREALLSRALRFLESRRFDLKVLLAPDTLAQLQRVTIVLDLTHGKLRTMQYHPDAGWLRESGYATNLVKCVNIPVVADLATACNINQQPMVVLHELAHAYHDQMLGFEEPRSLKAYQAYKRKGRGNHTLLYDGTKTQHYGLTDQKEFFAEMTEACFGMNDFFPFNRAELMTGEPEIFGLMQTIWGPVSGVPKGGTSLRSR